MSCEGHPSNSTQMTHNSKQRTHVVLLTATRCGSSFVGQLLNLHPDVFYLFEPLHAVQSRISGLEVMVGACRDLLRSLFQCELYELERYLKPTPTSHMTSTLFRRSASRMLCQQPLCQAFTANDTHNEEQCDKKCVSLNLTTAAQVCRQTPFVAMKTVRLYMLEDLRPLLEDPRLNVKVIQLVRDPRGVMKSRMEAFPDIYPKWMTWKLTGERPLFLNPQEFTLICDRFFKSVSTALSRPSWLKGRYMLVRYEDLSRSPLEKTREIYDFLGLHMTPDIEAWIQANTNGAGKAQVKKVFATIRDSAANTESWRLSLPFDMVEFTQGLCQNTMKQLGYRDAHSAVELKNLNVSFVLDKTFLPF